MSEIKFTKIVSALFLVNALEVLPGAANGNLKYCDCYTVLYDCGVSSERIICLLCELFTVEYQMSGEVLCSWSRSSQSLHKSKQR